MTSNPSHLVQLQLLRVIKICVLTPLFILATAEKQALIRFKSNLHDPLNYLRSWNSSNSPCQYVGVSCDPISGKVIRISLNNMNLGGNISSSLSHIQSLTSLVLANNNLNGTLPTNLRNLTQLQTLNLSGNYFFGGIPDLTMLKRLRVLDLSENLFSGHFPSWVGNLTSLFVLQFGFNVFKEAEISESIGKLKNLTKLSLRSMNLIGGLSQWIFELNKLENLDVMDNMISGNVPSSISKLNKLVVIELSLNSFTGELPKEMANLTLLRAIDISDNQFHGNLHQKIGELKNLEYLGLANNSFSGNFPIGFAYMPFLSEVYIFQNNFTGKFPMKFGEFSPLSEIDISENMFVGEFPRHLCANKKLQYLLALSNSFTGEFPASYSNCKTLTRIRVNDNLLSGNIPNGLWALPHVSLIDLSNNDFTGRITFQTNNSTCFTEIILSNNRFSSDLPQAIGNYRKLERLVLSNNNLSGQIPRRIRYLTELSSLQLDGNSFYGTIPSELAECISLSQINLAWNSLTGDIPRSLSTLNLNSLNISRNKISGLIPQSLTKLKLSLLDFSKNRLSGIIPIEIYIMGGDNGFLENEGLCLPFDLAIRFDSKIKRCNSNQSHKRTSFHILALRYAFIPIVVVVLIYFLVVKIINKHNISMICLTKFQVEEDDEQAWETEIFNPRIKINVTDILRLTDENIVGRGSTSIVYRLNLNRQQPQIMIAVKLLQMQGFERIILKSFFKEMEILSKTRHKNILKLYAYFKKGRSYYLILELMENGNLHEAIHGEPTSDLDFSTRYKIAVGVAQGLSYLHHDCSPPIIHRDIKSSNILLNDKYEPKISDFGIAKCKKMSTTSSNLIGTHGYMSPELAYLTKATEKSDVYSYGIVLLELMTGRKPIEEEFGEGRSIVSWVQDLWQNKDGDRVLDQRLTATSTRNRNGMKKVMDIALRCTVTLPSSRPSMRDVVNMLLD